MESQRNILLIGLLFVSFLMWQQWQTDKAPQPAAAQTVSQTNAAPQHSDDVPEADVIGVQEELPATKNLISVKTDKLVIKISPIGGDIVYAALVEHKREIDSNDPFVILDQQNDFTYIAQSGLIGRDGIDSSANGRATYNVQASSYFLAEDKDTLTVPFTFTADNGVTYVKTFTFTRGQYDVGVDYTINNTSTAPLQVQMYGQIKQTIKESESSMIMPTYRGGAFSSEDTRYEKYNFDDMADKNLAKVTLGGWAAMLQHYFVSAWVPPAIDSNTIFSRVSGGLANIGFRGAVYDIAPGVTQDISSQFYVGPKNQKALSAISETLNLVVDYGFLWWLAIPIHWLLMFYQSFVGNWGVAIILITLTVRGGLYPLTKKQYTSMAKMRNLQPKMTEMKERFGDDRQKMGQAMMELYKKEKVNPMGGCLPILLQMPIFIALYWVLLESYELRHAPFMLWINDLSVQDPYYVLPLLMGLSMFLMQKMQPVAPTMDPMQVKMMQWMPVIFTVFFLWFPAGLVLYWLVGNLVAITQQKIIYAGLEKNGIK
ncbi:MAG: membrane protein insertase YidC [Shewanella psychromarinicola]|jgi:YidC/Oxa1 family membrane protein insertase|uniref:Membrane protein insertase YidC n=1 Tax=Shewanella psychromarinicola TaxID=2487742 RepID=A0A3N4E2L5_9GAMM|nr:MULTISPECIES: membrane protein insertase YidC [Shewanella]AZG34335.1 membrane protein insertase YidC [Shewanella psychromarinicola]MCL1082565.1 membrane protein insertase YidC [Shewanella psychromarinicola]PKG79336.1 membrane protein insertase YidC [Shewanella sp. Actino-trap-3]RPA32435.1 membrane protein insertase YidC [Shewanella psychromarinicola]|tara:strand:+ start:40167 stop:41792 length:1626 start_codon:yes stop_codon:yes gene_type:complete